MSSALPDWHSTDEDEVSIPVRYVQSTKQEPIPPTVIGQRKTAAITGIITVLGIGLLLFGGIGGLLGQLTTPDVEISILSNRIEPAIANAAVGQRVRFINNSDIPQIIAADNDIDQELELESPIILPDDYYDWLVPNSLAQGTYTFSSKTNEELTGTIIIGLEAMPAVTTTPVVATSSSSIPEQPIQVAEEATPVPQGSIPVNPHAINGSVTNTVQPVPTSQPSQAVSSQASVTTHTPIQNTESGIGLWTLVVVGFLAFMGLLRIVSKQ